MSRFLACKVTRIGAICIVRRGAALRVRSVDRYALGMHSEHTPSTHSRHALRRPRMPLRERMHSGSALWRCETPEFAEGSACRKCARPRPRYEPQMSAPCWSCLQRLAKAARAVRHNLAEEASLRAPVEHSPMFVDPTQPWSMTPRISYNQADQRTYVAESTPTTNPRHLNPLINVANMLKKLLRRTWVLRTSTRNMLARLVSAWRAAEEKRGFCSKMLLGVNFEHLLHTSRFLSDGPSRGVVRRAFFE